MPSQPRTRGPRAGSAASAISTGTCSSQSFEAELDNITVFRHDGDRDGVPIQTLHRTFLLGYPFLHGAEQSREAASARRNAAPC